MITKRRLKKYMTEIDILISVAIASPDWYIKDPAALLTETVLRLGFQPRICPNLQFYKVAKESSDGVLNLKNDYLRNAYFNDLKSIRAMLDGIYYNTWRYNLRGLDKIVSTTLSYGGTLLLGGKP